MRWIRLYSKPNLHSITTGIMSAAVVYPVNPMALHGKY